MSIIVRVFIQGRVELLEIDRCIERFQNEEEIVSESDVYEIKNWVNRNSWIPWKFRIWRCHWIFVLIIIDEFFV